MKPTGMGAKNEETESKPVARHHPVELVGR